MNDPFTFDSTDETCVVCGKSVGGGRGYAHLQFSGRTFALCCPLCLETFQKNPDYYDIVREAAQALRPAGKPKDGA
jgi:hypothetical protein